MLVSVPLQKKVLTMLDILFTHTTLGTFKPRPLDPLARTLLAELNNRGAFRPTVIVIKL